MSDNTYYAEDHDFQLLYYTTSAELAHLFNNERVDGSCRRAYDYISLNLKFASTGVSRKVDVKSLAEYLNLSERQTRRVLTELERIKAIVPKSKTERRVYILPYVSKLREEMKNLAEKKKVNKIERKIQLLLIVLNRQYFSERQNEQLSRLFSKKLSFEAQMKEIEKVTYHQMTVAEEYRIKEEFGKLDI